MKERFNICPECGCVIPKYDRACPRCKEPVDFEVKTDKAIRANVKK